MSLNTFLFVRNNKMWFFILGLHICDHACSTDIQGFFESQPDIILAQICNNERLRVFRGFYNRFDAFGHEQEFKFSDGNLKSILQDLTRSPTTVLNLTLK